MATQKETANIVFLMLGIGSVGLLASVMAKQAGGGTGLKPGDVMAQGEEVAGNGQQFQWRVISSYPGADHPHTGQAKLAGFGQWDADTIVAMAPSLEGTQGLVLEYLSALA